MVAVLKTDNFLPMQRQQYYNQLLKAANGSANSRWLAQILANWQIGMGVLPTALGLKETEFNALLAQYFPGYPLNPNAVSGRALDFSRMLEREELEQFLRQFAVGSQQENEWLIALLVAASLGSDHLWQDLGLFSRDELSQLLQHNFPTLAMRNTHNMKWKKFIYKQLCEAEGLYVCRAPSCEVCKDHPLCFGPEHS